MRGSYFWGCRRSTIQLAGFVELAVVPCNARTYSDRAVRWGMDLEGEVDVGFAFPAGTPFVFHHRPIRWAPFVFGANGWAVEQHKLSP